MDLESLFYFMETAKDLHITETANRLYMSQQTLSNHIQRVEENYGVKLFNRRPRLQLTPAGREVLNFAEEVFAGDKNLKDVLTDALSSDKGEIIIGASSPRYNSYFPQILPQFSEMYPNVDIIVVDKTSDYLEKLVQKNELDFAVVVDAQVNHPSLETKSVHNDQLYFCVSDRLLKKYYGEETGELKRKSFPGAQLEDFKKIPFLTISSNNRLGKRIERCFQEAGYVPRSYIKATYTTMMVPLCNDSLAGCFTSQMNLSVWKEQLADDVNIFPLSMNGRPVSMTINLINHRQRYLNHHARYFLKLTEEYFTKMERQQLARLA